ncbi:hypothetical protein BDZ91DRAFT_795719 [Kalaharituber pfeilii]|nr:hypothetical protein BDZ91DRAFT_795719 [Kalaharituber pfeilii]
MESRLVPWYHIAEPNTYLVITGAGIEGLRITKKAWVKPWQKVQKISLTPFDFSLELQAMTQEKLMLIVPVAFTIGPEDTPDALTKYSSLLTGTSDGAVEGGEAVSNNVRRIVRGIIEGETRVLVSNMTAEEIFTNRALFKTNVTNNVQTELSKFGLVIYNSNVKDLKDPPGSEYFSFLSRKAHESASSKARIDESEARRKGEIGVHENEGLAKQQISKIEADTAILETQRGKDKASAQASLAIKTAELEAEVAMTKIKAQRIQEARDAELQKDVESKRAQMQLERLRATEVTKAQIAKESSQQSADAAHYLAVKNADAKLYAEQKAAEAASYETVKRADNDYYATIKAAEASFLDLQKKAEARYYQLTKEAEAAATSKKLEAEAVTEMAKAYQELSAAFGGPDGLLKYLMIERGVYTELARANAEAIRGLNPKINVWNTGPAGSVDGGLADPMAPIRNIFQSLPPMLSAVQEQTGITPPTWMMQMPQQKGSDGNLALEAAESANGNVQVVKGKAVVRT